MQLIHTKNHRSGGFTIVEMLVSTALFAMVVMMCTASFVVLSDANKKARSVKTAMDNLNLVMDDMAQELRLGSRYYCSSSLSFQQFGSEVSDCESGGSYLAFRDKSGMYTLYRFSPSEMGGCIQRKKTTTDWSYPFIDSSSGYSCMTPSDITIDSFKFYVGYTDPFSLSDASTWFQPRIVIVIKGTVGTDTKTRSSFSLMTSVTQRIPHNVEEPL